MKLRNCSNLDELWSYVEEINRTNFPENKLMPILGNGETHNPRIMFVFINPTVRNISSEADWQGPRFPFIGTKQIWRIFYKADLLNQSLIDRINVSSRWSVEFTNELLQFLKKERVYLTNIVKWTGQNAALPDSKKIKLFLPVLEREIELVNPERVVTFGAIPFTNLTKRGIKLFEYYKSSIREQKLRAYKLQVGSAKTEVIPCYFPIGRGNPKRAIELLKLLQ
ncbi:MAG: uracil-DNA glycosylase family protein [Candidatus Marsarchaeota archaeon]|nr:uracil-DNA glycosylase family protein [Candidatus Marsarchaeota archaeon]